MSNIIDGQVLAEDGTPLVGAIVEITDHVVGNDDRGDVIRRETDLNGEFEIEYHPEGDGTSKQWHLMIRDKNGEQLFNAVSEPRRDASLKSGLTFFVRDSQDETVQSGEILTDHTRVKNQANSRLVSQPNSRVKTQTELEIQ